MANFCRFSNSVKLPGQWICIFILHNYTDSSTSRKKSEKMNFTESFRVIKQGNHHYAISRLYSRRRVVWREVKCWCGKSQPFPSHYTALHQEPSSKVRQGEGKSFEQRASAHKPHRLCLPSGSRKDEEAGADSFMFSILPRAGHIKHSCTDLGDNCSSSTSH